MRGRSVNLGRSPFRHSAVAGLTTECSPFVTGIFFLNQNGMHDRAALQAGPRVNLAQMRTVVVSRHVESFVRTAK